MLSNEKNYYLIHGFGNIAVIFLFVVGGINIAQSAPKDPGVKKTLPEVSKKSSISKPDVAVYGRPQNSYLEIRKAASKKYDFNFKNETLENIAKKLSSEINVPIHFKVAILEEEGILIEDPASIVVKNQTVSSGLTLLLNGFQLEYVIDDDRILITTTEDARTYVETRIYDVSKIVEKSSDIIAPIQMIDPEVWNEQDGSSVVAIPGAVIVRASQKNHLRIEVLMEVFAEYVAKAKKGVPLKAFPSSPAVPRGGGSNFF